MKAISLSTVEVRAGWAPVCGATALLALSSVIGCEPSSSSAKSPTDQAAALVRTRCAANAEEATLAPVLDGTAIESVEPLYSSVVGAKTGQVSELHGSSIKVRALPGVTAEWLTQALECHTARRALGSLPSTGGPNDPFWLPGQLVHIDVTSAHDGFRVDVHASGPAEGQQVLDRARAVARNTSPSGAL
jgi:hypothetical protein